MSLKVIDGLRTIDGANAAMDMNIQTITAVNTVNGSSHDMKNHFEFIAVCLNDATEAGATCTFVGQESNDDSTFTNISGSSAVIAADSANTVELIQVDWKHPDRKRYARVAAVVTGANTSIVGIVGMRVQAKGGDLSVDDNVDIA